MANVVKNAIIRTKVEGILVDLMVKTNAANVYVNETTTLSAKLAEIIASVDTKASTEAMNDAISAAIDGLIDGAPDTYNTLKEIANYINQHTEVVDALNAAIGNKADKTELQTVQSAVETMQASVHTHANKAVLDGVTAEKVAEWDGKTNMYCSATQPADLSEGDLWFQTTD